MLLVLALVLPACGTGGSSLAPTTPPVIIVDATPANESTRAPNAPTRAAATATPRAAATTAQPANQPTSAASTPQAATAQPGQSGTSKGQVVVAFDSFPSYFPLLIMKQRGLLEQRGYELVLVPFGLNGENDVPEAERFETVRQGGWDILATTLDGFARRADPSIGAITALVDESAGADKIVANPEIATINDLRGKRVAYSEGSVGEYFLYYALSLAGLGPNDVTLVPKESVEDAVNAYIAGEADAVSGWVPDVQAAEDAGAKVVIASDKLRAIVDVLITGRNVLDNKGEAGQAFHDAWFEALRLMTDSPDEAEQAIIDWGNNDWTAIDQPGVLADSLQTIAQATLGANALAFRNPESIVTRVREAQTVWANAGQAPPQSDLNAVVDGRFVLASAGNGSLISTRPPVNSSFLFTARVELPQLSSEEQQQAEAVVKLPLEKIDFQPESVRLTDKAIQDLTAQVLPVLRTSRLYLRIEGSAAWPGPQGRFREEDIRSFAAQRAESVATFLVQQGIDPNRLITGTLPPKFPNSTNETELVQDRIVRFTLVTSGGR
jgi:NitT/TauT family transport system substrate-binding protein